MTTPTVESFQSAAAAFCELAKRSDPLRSEDLGRIRELLLQLILHIPAVEAHRHDVEHEVARIDATAYAAVVEKFSHLPINFYRVVFDPFDFAATDEPVVGSIADDLADIYRDLSEGLDHARQGHLEEACFNWASSYRSHWCHHAVGAITALELHRMKGDGLGEEDATLRERLVTDSNDEERHN